MRDPARIELPEAPRGVWSRGSAIWLMASVIGTFGFGAWGSDGLHPGPLAAASLCFLIVLLLLTNVAATAGRSAWVLVERAGAPSLAARISDMWQWTFGACAVATILGVALSGAAPGVQAIAPALAAGGVALAIAGIVGRITLTHAAHRLVVRLSTSTLAQLEGERGSLELAVTVPADAPLIEVPFLHGKWAAVELLLDDEPHRWPERLPVRDATDTGELVLTTCNLSGWRCAVDSVVWWDKVPPLAVSFRAAVGTHGRLAGREGSVTWCVRAIAPGDTLYIIGDAEEVRRGFGFRVEGQITVGTTSDRAAFAYLGDETRLRTMLTRELRYLPLVVLLGGAGLAALVSTVVRFG